MKKTLLILGTVAMMATFNACGDCEHSAGNATTVDTTATTDADAAKCGEGKCGEGKCGEGKGQKTKFNKLDADKDGLISKEEFTSDIDTKYADKDKNSDGKITADECPMFDKFSTEGNDFLSKEELAAGVEVIFTEADTDADGFLSKDEMKTLMSDMKSGDKCGADDANEAKCGEGKCGEGK